MRAPLITSRSERSSTGVEREEGKGWSAEPRATRRCFGRARGSVLALSLALAAGVGLASIGTAADADALARRPLHGSERLQQSPGPAELFRRQCAACHGKKGEGDGPAASAMNPRPADLTDAERIGDLSDEELIEVLTKGRSAMPSFGSLLEVDQIRAMVAYIRELSGTESEARPGGPS